MKNERRMSKELKSLYLKKWELLGMTEQFTDHHPMQEILWAEIDSINEQIEELDN